MSNESICSVERHGETIYIVGGITISYGLVDGEAKTYINLPVDIAEYLAKKILSIIEEKKQNEDKS